MTIHSALTACPAAVCKDRPVSVLSCGRIKLAFLTFWFILFGTLYSGLVPESSAHELIDVVPDEMSLRMPLEILQRPPLELPERDRLPLFEGLEQDWFTRKRNLSIGDEEVGTQMLEKIHEEMLNLGVKRMRPYAASLMREASYHADRGGFERAEALCRAAVKFAPNMPEPHLLLAQVYWKESKLKLSRIVLQWLQAGRAFIKNGEYGVSLLTKLALLALVACTVFFAVFYLVQMLRYFRLLVHDFGEILPGEPSGKLLAFAGLFGIFAPLLLGWGFYALCVFWLLLLWSYSTFKERAVHLLFLFFMASIPLWFGVIQNTLEGFNTERGQVLGLHRDGISDDTMLLRLQRLSEANPGDDEVFFMLGTAFKKRSEYRRAERAFKKAISLNPHAADYYNNLGNTYYALRDLERAVANYEKAIEKNSQEGAFHFNLSATLRERLKLNESDKEYFLARKLDPEKISHYAAILGPNYNRMVIDSVLHENGLWHAIAYQMRSLLRGNHRSDESFRALLIYGIQPLILIVLVILLHYLRRVIGTARKCKKCGIVFCKKCQSAIRKEPVCSQCVHFFEDQASVGVKQRTRKIIEIRKYKENHQDRKRLIGILLPGGGHIYQGRMLIGFLIIFLVTGFLTYSFFPEIFSSSAAGFRLSSSHLRYWSLIPAMLVYGLSLLHLRRLSV
jgi:tetratricopeptide (TPR) repeat protein